MPKKAVQKKLESKNICTFYFDLKFNNLRGFERNKKERHDYVHLNVPRPLCLLPVFPLK